MKVFGICGSPRRDGNSQWALERALDEFSKHGYEISKVLLSEANIKITDGSLPEELENNPIDDDMKSIEKEMISSDFIVITSPTYFDNITPHLKNFIDRTDPFYKNLQGKNAIIIVVGQADEDSWMSSLGYLKLYCDIARISVRGELMFKALHKGDLRKNEAATTAIETLVKKVV